MFLVDSHVHLDAEQFDSDRKAVIARAQKAGVEVLICPGITAASSQATVRLAETYQGVFAAVGIHPNYAAQAGPDDWQQVEKLAGRSRVVAIGETGLDAHWGFTPMEVQKDYFDRHLRLAQREGLPVIVHCREAEDEVLQMLRQAAQRGPLAGVMHAFSGDLAFARSCLQLGLHLGLAGSVTYRNRKFIPLREAACVVPDDRLLVETDSPYLVPHPFRGKLQRNEPARLVHTVQCLAELRSRPIEELAAQTTANARRLFQLP